MPLSITVSKNLSSLNALSSFAVHLLNISVLVWLQQYLLRRISLDEYALYPVLMSVMAIFPIVTTMFTSSLGRYIVGAYARKEGKAVIGIYSTMLLVFIVLGFILLAGGGYLSWKVDHFLDIVPVRHKEAQFMMALMVFSFVVQFVTAPLQIGFFVRQKFVLLNLITVSIQLLRIALLFILFVFIDTRVLWLVVSTIVADLCGVVLRIIIAQRFFRLPAVQLKEIHLSYLKKLTTFGGWITLITIAGSIRKSAYPILLNKLGTAADVSSFHVGSIFFNQIEQLFGLMKRTLNPALTAMYATGDEEHLSKVYLRGGRYALWGGMFIVSPLVIMRHEFVSLYVGDQFPMVATVIGLLLLRIPLSFGNTLMWQLCFAMAKMKELAITSIVIYSASFLLSLYMVSVLNMGAIGCALSSLIVSAIVQPLIYWPLGRRLANVVYKTWVRKTLRPGLLPGLFEMAACLVFKETVGISTWADFSLCLFVGSACYCAILLAFCLRDYDRRMIREIRAKLHQQLKRQKCS